MAPSLNTQTITTAMEPATHTARVVNGKGPAIDTVYSIDGYDPSYWWRTSGRDLAGMLHEANYPEEAQRQFLGFFRDTLCPLLGNKPECDSLHAAVGWDGNPFEYSFEFKGSTKNPGVRFVLDLSKLRPCDEEHPLSIANIEKVLDTLAKRSPMFDDAWVRYRIITFLFNFEILSFRFDSLSTFTLSIPTALVIMLPFLMTRK